MYKNTIKSENTPDSHKKVITDQLDHQLAQIAAGNNVDSIKTHFEWVLINDFYKNELSSDKITEMESYLDANYADKHQDIPS
tara:strand:+ start:697 stop:942 length:246 start_codon:yes stop_codon:yes gene_type:complete